MTNKFVKKPVNKASIGNRKLVCGAGVNDADYMVSHATNWEMFHCQFYVRWQGMLKRCYLEKSKIKNPRYIGCSVCDEWLLFSNFRDWMTKQDWQGKELDKDIVITGNKIYSPQTCIFVSSEINKLLTDSAATRGAHPQGVHFSSRLNKFISRCTVYGKSKYLGLFETSEDASNVYKEFKSNHIKSIANQQTEPLKGYLIRISGEIRVELAKQIHSQLDAAARHENHA